jgi:hypothetical protein
MKDDTNIIVSESTMPTTHEPPVLTPPESEPAFLARARRILGGYILPEDYLAVPAIINSAVANETSRLIKDKGFKISNEVITRMRNDWTLQFVHGGQPVACRYTDASVIVFAVGTEEIRMFLERFPRPDERSGVVITTPPLWQAPNLADLQSLSPQPLPRSG